MTTRFTVSEYQERARNRITTWLLCLLTLLVLGVVAALVTPHGHSAFTQGKSVVQVAFATLGIPLGLVVRYYFRGGRPRFLGERRGGNGPMPRLSDITGKLTGMESN